MSAGDVTWAPPRRPVWLERLIAHGESVGGAAWLVPLDAKALIESSATSTGLDDFGDGPWRTHYETLLSALDDESHLHLAGRLLARAEVLRSLRNRLALADLWRRRPEILESSVLPPVFVVGSARSGTSILHELLACDPASRAPAMWEMLHPVEALSSEALRPAADRVVRFWHDLQPEYETMHRNSGDLPNECIFITMNEFLSDHWSGCHAVPSYDLHAARADHGDAYRFHRRVLQTLQCRGGGERWVLKAPSHLFHLRRLFEVYPDARIVRTHRDPLKTLPSSLSLLGTLKWMRCERVDMAGLSRMIPRGLARAHDVEAEGRDVGALPDERFVDVLYSDLQTDPIRAVASIYGRLGWTLTDDARRAMTDHLAARPAAARGLHRYSLGEFGLDTAHERARFRSYQARFRVPDEA